MRERQVRAKDVNRYITFLQNIRDNAIENNPDNYLTIEEIIKSVGVSKSVTFAMSKLGIINRSGERVWTFEHGMPTEKMALQVLDFNLTWRKKKQKQPTIDFGADFQTLIERLQVISEDIKKCTTSPKNTPQGIDMKFELIKAIATGVYSEFSDNRINYYKDTNNDIIMIANDLYNQYLKTK